jgi:hypothetical protein
LLLLIEKMPIFAFNSILNALRRLTRRGDPSVMIRAISRVRQFSANIIGDNFEKSREYLEKCNAFKDGEGYILRF